MKKLLLTTIDTDRIMRILHLHRIVPLLKLLTLLRVETGRLLRSRFTWVCILLAAVLPAVGLRFYRPLVYSISGMAIGNPALAGAVCGAIFFAILTAGSFHNRHRFRVDAITDAIHSPHYMAVTQTISLIVAAVVTQACAIIVWFPYAASLLGDVFSFKLYLSIYLAVMLPALCFAVLFTASVYQLTGRFDLSLVLFAAFALLSLTAWNDNWLLRWVNPPLAYISDVFGNSRKIMSIGYNRLFWSLALAGFWSLSLLCVRRYGKGLIGSASRNVRKAYIPVIAVALAFAAVYAYAAQPFLDHSPNLIEYPGLILSSMSAPEGESIICGGIYVDARPDLSAGRLHATATYELRSERGASGAGSESSEGGAGGAGNAGRTVSFELNPGYKVLSVTANDQDAVHRDLADDDKNMKTIEVDLPQDADIVLTIEYGGFPTEWNIMALLQGGPEISRDYIYLANANFSPIPKNFIIERESFAFTADIELPEGMVPVLFGTGTAEKLGIEAAASTRAATRTSTPAPARWRLTSSSNSIILYAGGYVSHRIDAAGTDVEFIYNSKHSRSTADFDMDAIISNVFEYCTEHIGRLSFAEGGTLKLIEIGSFGGGYAGLGASVMGEDSFSVQRLSGQYTGGANSDGGTWGGRTSSDASDGTSGDARVSASNGANDSTNGDASGGASDNTSGGTRGGASGDETLAHEIIHQWWGLSNMFEETRDSDSDGLWSAEGLTVYTTYRLMKHLHGEDYAVANYVDVWRREVSNYYDNFYVRHPEYFDALPEKYRADIMNSYAGMRQYCEMPLMLLKAEELVGGEEAFDKILYDIFNREFNEDYSNYLLSYGLFLEYCGLSKEDLHLGQSFFV